MPSAPPPDAAKENTDLLERYYSARSAWAAQAMEDDQFRNSVQWTKEQIDILQAKDQVPIVVNVIHQAVEQAKGILTANRPRFTGTAFEGSDTKVAAVLSDILAHIWEGSGGQGELKVVVDDYYVRGAGFFLAYIDPLAEGGKGEVRVTALDAFDVYIDPSSRNRLIQDAQNVLVARLFTREQYLLDYPQYADRLAKATPTSVDRRPSTMRKATEGQQIGMEIRDRETEYFEVIDRYQRVRVNVYELYHKQEDFKTELEEEHFKAWLQEPALLIATPDGQLIGVNDAEGSKQIADAVQQGQIPPEAVKQVTNAELVQAGIIAVNIINVQRIRRVMSVSDQLMYDGIIPKLEIFPIVPFFNRHNRNPYPMSDVRLVRPLQEYINKLRSLIIAHASNSTNTKLIIPKGSQDKAALREEWGRAGTAVVEYDAELGGPTVAGPVPLPAELYRNEAQARQDIEGILGIYALMQGDSTNAPNTYRGTMAMEEFGQRRMKGKMDDLEATLSQLGRVCIQLMQATYTESRVIRIVNPNFKPREIQLNVPVYSEFNHQVTKKTMDVTVGRYDVIVVSGSTLPSNRWARFEAFKELYQLGVIDDIELLKQTEIADIEGVLERKSQMMQLMGQVQQLQAQLKQVTGDLQTAQRESVSDRKRVEVLKFATELHQKAAMAGAATKLYEARLADETQMHRERLMNQADMILQQFEADKQLEAANAELSGTTAANEAA